MEFMSIKCFMFCYVKISVLWATICNAPGSQASWFIQPAQQICFISLCCSYPKSWFNVYCCSKISILLIWSTLLAEILISCNFFVSGVYCVVRIVVLVSSVMYGLVARYQNYNFAYCTVCRLNLYKCIYIMRTSAIEVINSYNIV